jgi:hypothetical protein
MLIEPLMARRQKQQAFREARRPSGEHRDD